MTVAEHNTLHHKGFKHSEKTKKQISNSMKGEKNHFYGKSHSEKSKKKISDAKKGQRIMHSDDTKSKLSKLKNSTGYRNVSIHNKSNTCPYFRYNYFEGGKCSAILSTSISDLKRKVLSKNFKWEIFDEELARKTDELSKQGEEHRNKYCTDYLNVRKRYYSHNGVRYVYTYKDKHGKLRYISSKHLNVLKNKVISKGLVWKKIS